MKNCIKQFLPMPMFSVFVFAGGLYAQTQATTNMEAPRLASPVVIPAMTQNTKAGLGSVSAATGVPAATQHPPQAVQKSQSAPAVGKGEIGGMSLASGSTPSPTLKSRSPAGPALDMGDNFNELMAEAKRQDKATAKANVPGPGGSAEVARRAEMITRMRLAVEQIAAEYGNPTFAQVFTNDSVQAQILRKRVQLLHRAEAINAEIMSLEKQKNEIKGEVDASRRELLALQSQADALTKRLQRASVLLGMSN